ncbi:MAG: PAS domain S-box protein [Gaiellaceae bacterium]
MNPPRKRRSLKASPVDDDLLRTIFENAAMGVAVADAGGQILTCNPALERMLGYRADEWARLQIVDTVHPDDREKIEQANETLFSGKSDALVAEHRFLHKNGEPVWVRASVSLMRDEQGAPHRLIAIFEDLGERKRAEESAANTRALMERLLATTDALVVQLNNAGEIEFVNRAFEQISGYTREEIGKQNWFEVLVPKDRYPQVWEEFQRLTSGGTPTRFENQILSKSGEERYIVWRNSELQTRGEITGTISIGIEISERKRAEEALADSEAKLLAVFRSVPIAIAVSDPTDGRIYDVNEEYERVFECSYDDVVGKTSIELGFWVDPTDRERLIDLVAKNGKVEGFELALQTTSGKALTGRINATPIAVGGSGYLVYALEDISERKLAQEQIEMLKRSIDMHPDGAYWLDAKGEFVYVNEAGCRSVGYALEELLGKPVGLVNPAATPERMKEIWKKLRGEGSYTSETIHRRKDGSEFPAEITSTYIRLGDKEYNCGFARDISERKRSDEERALLARQLQQAQKMEAVGRLAGGVAHSFNNILTALGGYCEILLAKLPEGSDCRPEAEQIKRASDHAASITRELLLFSRREAARQVRLDLNTVVVQTQLLLRELIRSDIKIVTALAPVVPLALADRGQIEQVLINLVVNATDAMPGGGVIGIETGDLEIATARPAAGGATLEPGRYVTLVVKDSGVGMDEAVLSHIFEPFFTTKGPDKGTGLGLATVYGIVEESGGRIAVESEPKNGSSFTIYFPALPARS